MMSVKITHNHRRLFMTSTVVLDIPPRLQWENGHGYCGEACVQSFGLYYGAWISQQLVRDINHGEYLIGTLATETLSILGFTYEKWDSDNSSEPQFNDYCAWIKKSIIRGHPVMIVAYLLYFHHDDYDHIMPAIGIEFKDENQYDPEDVLIYYNLFHDKQIRRVMSKTDLGGTRKSCRKNCDEGGCVPWNIDYGIAVTGIRDENHVTLPVRLSVSAWNEPNLHPAYGESPVDMDGIVTVRDLSIGKSYVLLRYSSYEYVPTRGNVNDFLLSKFDEKHEFVADQTTYTYADPKKICSTGSVYYRCVPKPE